MDHHQPIHNKTIEVGAYRGKAQGAFKVEWKEDIQKGDNYVLKAPSPFSTSPLHTVLSVSFSFFHVPFFSVYMAFGGSYIKSLLKSKWSVLYVLYFFCSAVWSTFEISSPDYFFSSFYWTPSCMRKRVCREGRSVAEKDVFLCSFLFCGLSFHPRTKRRSGA